MRRNFLLCLSGTLNLGLALMLVWFGRGSLQLAGLGPGAWRDAQPLPTPAATRIEPEPSSAPTSVPNPFHWSSVASTNYAIYAANLRAIGCPAGVVHDIIRATVDHDYAARRHALLRPYEARFWEIMLQAEEAEKGMKPVNEACDRLANDREEELMKALGDHWREPPEDSLPGSPVRPQWAFLAESKQDALAALEADWAERRRQLAAKAQPNTPGPTAALAEAVQLRGSAAANWVQSLPGLDLNEDELRALARLRQRYGERRTNEFNAQAQALLGDERFRTLERAQNKR